MRIIGDDVDADPNSEEPQYESQMKTFPWKSAEMLPRNAITPHASKCANFESTYLMPMILWSKIFRVHCKVVVKIFAALYLLGKWSLFRYSCNLVPNYVGALQNIYKTLYILERCQHLGKQCQSIAGNGGFADGMPPGMLSYGHLWCFADISTVHRPSKASMLILSIS